QRFRDDFEGALRGLFTHRVMSPHDPERAPWIVCALVHRTSAVASIARVRLAARRIHLSTERQAAPYRSGKHRSLFCSTVGRAKVQVSSPALSGSGSELLGHRVSRLGLRTPFPAQDTGARIGPSGGVPCAGT